MTTHARVLTLAAVLATALFAGGCTSSSSAGSPTSSSSAAAPSTSPASSTTMAPAAGDSTITIHNFAFGSSITVKAGATVTVKNGDTTTHTLAADDGSFDTGNIFAGKSATFVAPMQPGPHKFHCNIHANMHGVLNVTA